MATTMPTTKDALELLRQRLRDLSPPQSSEAVGDRDIVRENARLLGQKAALHFEALWSVAGGQRLGPIDVVDIFSGCGGMSAGFHALNSVLPAYRLAAAVDIDEVANQTYERNIGLRPLNEDVRSLLRRRSTLRPTLGLSSRRTNPLVLIGCAPCQGFSSHRNGAGDYDNRNTLVESFARLAIRLEPDVIVAENVPELLTERFWSHLEDARERLTDAGYVVHVSVENMAEYGVAQERYRAVMLASRKPFRPLSGFVARPAFKTVRDAIGSLPTILAGRVDAADPMHYTANHRPATIQTIRSVPKNGGNRPADGGPACLERAGRKHNRTAYEDVYGRLWWDRPAITVTAYARNPASGRFVHPEQDRGLTPREGASLQGFPSGYWFAGGLDPQFRQIGNAVPPIFSAYLAAHILGEVLSSTHVPEPGAGIEAPIGASFSRLIPALKAGYVTTRSLRATSATRAVIS